jgi:hypothetical protein
MPSNKERLAVALESLRDLQMAGKTVVRSENLPNRLHRILLLKNGFITEVLRGWFIIADPSTAPGSSTTWYANYWEFVTEYLNDRYGDQWSINADHSLLVHAGNRSVPDQLIIRSPGGNNQNTQLLHNTSLFNLKSDLPVPQLMIDGNGVRIYKLHAALIACSIGFFRQKPLEARTALGMIRSSSELLPQLLENGHSTIAGRLAGAFRNIGRDRIADEILDTMRAAGYDSREDDPFEEIPTSPFPRERSPYMVRIHLLWESMRNDIIKVFPSAPGISDNPDKNIKEINAVYVTDAYHSLSIEKYQVSAALIERVRSGQWNKDGSEEERKQRDAMAARGYYLAFQDVLESIGKILIGKNPGEIVDLDHSSWYRNLFLPSVDAGILKISDLAGYRNNQVYIANSKHVPLNVEALRDCMPLYFELLTNEPEPSVKAVLGHFVFVFIHPYMDGNGRMARFLMNAMLVSGGYPWTVIPVERRDEYMAALESASIQHDIVPFATLVSDLVSKTASGEPEASTVGR